jgi:hypothetical protein
LSRFAAFGRLPRNVAKILRSAARTVAPYAERRHRNTRLASQPAIRKDRAPASAKYRPGAIEPGCIAGGRQI